jgi:hypothetical protein
MKRFKNCILHAGTEKTGTTTLQEYLQINRPNLLQHGYYLPLTLGRAEHHRIASYASDEDRMSSVRKRAGATTGSDIALHRNEILSQFMKEVEAAPDRSTLVISSERCFSNIVRESEFERLKQFLEPVCDSISVFVYLRPQHEFAVSWHTTALKNGKRSRRILAGVTSAHEFYNYELGLDRWARQFGEANIHPRIYARRELVGQDICTDFMAAIGLDASEFTPVKSKNESLSAQAQEFLRVMNGVCPPFLDLRPNPLRGDLFQLLQSVSPGEGAKPLRAELERFYSMFEDSNAAVAKRWFPGRQQLFDLDFDKYPTEGSNPALTMADAAPIFGALWERKHAQVLRQRRMIVRMKKRMRALRRRSRQKVT